MGKFSRKSITVIFVFIFALGASLTLHNIQGQPNQEGLTDGTYTGTGRGFNDDITVEVVVRNNKIDAINVKEHQETPGISNAAIEQIPKRIIETQEISEDVVTGATYTSEGIKQAISDALDDTEK